MLHMKNKIGVLDSGVGGLTVLKKVIEKYPYHEYLYLADNKNNPYGNKTKEELLEITKKNIDYLKRKNCNPIILACGTISSNIYDELTTIYPEIKFIKALNNLDNLGSKTTYLFMATKRTVLSDYIKNKQEKNFYALACDNLAYLIENNLDTKDYLESLLEKYKNKKIDTLILGCTHYPLKEQEIKSIINPKNIITPADEVINDLSKILINNENKKLKVKIINTKKSISYNKRCYEIIKD